MSLDDLQAQLRGALDQQFAALKAHHEHAVAEARQQARTDVEHELEAKLVTARFYAEVILPPALAQLGPLKAAGRTVFALKEEQF